MEMIKKEWQAIFKNKMLLATFIVVSFIPILYAAFFLKSVWDPYGKTGELPVAVVNEDKEIDYNGKTLQIGQDLVDQLKEDNNLNWQFVTADEAHKGLVNQEYYMIVTIPENFSANAATVMDDEPQKMNIKYETNGALNYLGEVVGETAMKQLKSEVSKKVTEVYAKTIFEKLSEMKDGFSQAADGASQLDDGAAQLADGGQTLNDGLQTLAESTITFSDGESTFTVGLSKYLEGTVKLDDGLTELKNGVDTLGEKVPDLADGVGQLDDGSTKLSKGINDYTDGVAKLADGSNTLASKGNTLQNGVNTLVSGITDGADQLKSGAASLSGGLEQMSEQLGTQIDGSKDQITQLNQGLTTINQGLQDLNAALQAGTSSSVDLSQITGALTQIEQQVAAIESNASSSTEIQDAVKQTSEWSLLSATEQQEILDAIANVSGGKETAIISSTGAISGYTNALSVAMSTLGNSSSVATLAGTVQQLANGSATVLPGAQQAIAKLSGGLTNVKTVLDGQIIPGMSKLENGIGTLQSSVSTGTKSLTDGMDAYIAGVKQVNDGLQKLDDNSKALSSGAATLSSGLSTLNDNVPTLQEGVEKLVKGTATIKDGSSELVGNNSQLMSGQLKLQDATNKLMDGSKQLADGSNTLLDGLNTLKDGTGELSTALGDGAEKVNEVHTSDKTAEMIAQPDEITQEKYSEVPNYGHALAPYVLSLALYVGCVVFNFVFPIRKIAIKEKSAFDWWLSKVTVGLVSATAMALIEGIIMIALGLQPDHLIQFFVMALITSYAYMFLIMFLAMAFDNPGRFVAMVLLILQLAGSGGTFPMPLTDKFFRVIHPFLPMTHSIYGFRQAISSGLGTKTVISNSIILLIITVVSQILLYISMKLLKKLHKDGLSQLDDNQKLLDDNYDYSYQ